jgi:hypothetical protein
MPPGQHSSSALQQPFPHTSVPDAHAGGRFGGSSVTLFDRPGVPHRPTEAIGSEAKPPGYPEHVTLMSCPEHEHPNEMLLQGLPRRTHWPVA